MKISQIFAGIGVGVFLSAVLTSKGMPLYGLMIVGGIWTLLGVVSGFIPVLSRNQATQEEKKKGEVKE